MCNVVSPSGTEVSGPTKETEQETAPLEHVHIIPNDDGGNNEGSPLSGTHASTSDTQSCSTYSTLFSDYYDDDQLLDDDESEDEKPEQTRLMRLEKSFAQRDEILTKLMVKDGKQSARYVHMLYRNEFTVRRAVLCKLEEEVEECEDNDERQRRKQELERLTESILCPKNLPKKAQACSQDAFSSAESLFFFETRHCLPGIATLCLFCLCHLSLYELITQILYGTTSHIQNQDALYLALLLLGALLCRISGGVFDWLNPQQYNFNKFDSHNRLRLKKWDALLLHRLKHSFPQLRYAIYYVGYCLVLICMYYFHSKLLSTLLDSKKSLLDSLPSQQPGRLINTPVDDRLRVALYGDGYELPTKPAIDDEGEPVCGTSWTGGASVEDYNAAWVEDYGYLTSQVSTSQFMAFMGDHDAALVPYRASFVFYTATVVLSIWLMRKMGFQHAS